MSYSRCMTEFDPEKQGTEYNYFSEAEWARYPFASEEDAKWFREAKYGLFLHVGIAAMGMVDISWSRHTHKIPDPMVSCGPVPDEEYDGWSQKLAFEHFDAKEWAKLAKESGFRYVVIITKHHDGFHMWDTAYSDYKITNAPFGRDYLKELVGAFRAEGLKIGFYFSQRDWTHPDYEAVPEADGERLNVVPYWRMKDGKAWYCTEKHKRYQEYLRSVIRELLTNYGRIDVLWWDSEYHSGMYPKEMWESEMVEQIARELQPHILINNRAGLPGDFDTPEGYTGFFQNSRMWECCMPLGPVWAYSPAPPKSFRTVLSQLLNCVGGDGNYLLSIGCKPDGSIAGTDAERMREIGAWLKEYGEGIYGSRGGIWKPTAEYAACYRRDTVWLYVLREGETVELSLPFAKNNLLSCCCLSGETVEANTADGRLHLTVSQKAGKTAVSVIRLTLAQDAVMEE